MITCCLNREKKISTNPNNVHPKMRDIQWTPQDITASTPPEKAAPTNISKGGIPEDEEGSGIKILLGKWHILIGILTTVVLASLSTYLIVR